MTEPNSKIEPDKLLERLVKYQELQQLAFRREDIPAANRHFDKIVAATKGLAADPEGRQVLENLLHHSSAFLRMRAAIRVLRWAPEKAVPVLGRILSDHLEEGMSPNERIEVRTTAANILYQHFGVRGFDRNKLIEPLQAYGVELPYQDHAKWQ